MAHIDFGDFRRYAESDPVRFMQVMQPGGAYDQRQREYYAASPRGGAGKSCKTSLRPDKMFVGQDFADTGFSWCGPIDIACAAFGLPRDCPQEAVELAAERLGLRADDSHQRWRSAPDASLFKPLAPPDESSPNFHLGDRRPSLVSVYKNPDGSLFCFMARYEADQQNARKLILPWAYGELGGVRDWHRKMPPGRRPLLGLDEFIEQVGEKAVLIVEGEKTREAAKRLAGGRFFVTTWTGGCQSVEKTDFRILDGSTIYIWPDADEPGRQAP